MLPFVSRVLTIRMNPAIHFPHYKGESDLQMEFFGALLRADFFPLVKPLALCHDTEKISAVF
jgi:hypothetical protein